MLDKLNEMSVVKLKKFARDNNLDVGKKYIKQDILAKKIFKMLQNIRIQKQKAKIKETLYQDLLRDANKDKDIVGEIINKDIKPPKIDNKIIEQKINENVKLILEYRDKIDILNEETNILRQNLVQKKLTLTQLIERNNKILRGK